MGWGRPQPQRVRSHLRPHRPSPPLPLPVLQVQVRVGLLLHKEPWWDAVDAPAVAALVAAAAAAGSPIHCQVHVSAAMQLSHDPTTQQAL